MGLKENFKQAARDLMGPAGEMEAEEISESTVESGASEEGWGEEAQWRLEPVIPVPEPPRAPQHRMTLIAEGTVIQGSIQAQGGLELYGEVFGDIASKEDLKLCGKLAGNAIGRNVELLGGRVKGDLSVVGRAYIDGGAMVIGNIQAESLVFNGKVKGDLTIRRDLTVEREAVILGAITAGRLTVAEGAAIQGEVRMSGMDVGAVFREEEEDA